MRGREIPLGAGQIRRVRRMLALAHALGFPGSVVAERGAERLGGGPELF